MRKKRNRTYRRTNNKHKLGEKKLSEMKEKIWGKFVMCWGREIKGKWREKECC